MRSLGSTIAFAASLATSALASPTELLEAVQGAELRLEDAVHVQAHRLSVGPVSLEIEEGLLVPASAEGAPVAEMIFLGKAWLVVDPPDEIEAGQLELFTGRRRLRLQVDEAAFAVTLDAAVEALLSGERASPDAAQSTSVQGAWTQWHESHERILLGVTEGLWLHGLGDPMMEDFFAGRLVTEKFGPLVLSVDPDAGEQLTLGRFVPLELDEREARKARKSIHRQQREGRLLGVSLERLGDFDTWMSTTLVGAGGFRYRGSPAFAARHYELELELSGRDETIRGRGRIELRPLTGGRRGVQLELHPDLIVSSVLGPSGQELPTLRRASKLLAILPEAPKLGEQVSIEVSWEGKGLEKLERGLFRLVNTLYWHPRLGAAAERATYEVTVTWPQSLDLVGSGRVVEEGLAPDGRRRQRRKLDVPSAGFSFELGRFDFERFRVGKTAVVVAFDKESKRESKAVRASVVWAVKDVLAWYSEVLGPYPLDHLTVVTVPREVSQGLPGFVTLSSVYLTVPESTRSFLGIEDGRTIIAHELAHQWWGNRVGFASYRDEWLSEGMSSWLALAWSDRIPKEDRPRVGASSRWRLSLEGFTRDGRPVESLGPMVLGRRLNSTLSSDGYPAIVYDKGAIVLNGLAASLGQDVFLQSLAAIGQVAEGKLMDTASFFRALEKVTGRELDDFVDTWVMGTGMPQVWYSTEMLGSEDGSGWVAKTTITQKPTYEWKYWIEPVEGGWDLRKRADPRLDVSRSVLTVPFALSIDDPARRDKKDDDGANAVLRGRLTIDQPEQVIEMPVQSEPKRLTLDPRARSFASFLRVDPSSGAGGYRRAWNAIAEGRLDDAERLARESEGLLSADLSALPQRLTASHSGKRMLGIMDKVIRHTTLAEILLDQGRLSEAEASLKEADKAPIGLVPSSLVRRRERLEARAAVARGDGRSALKALDDQLSGKEPRLTSDGWAICALAARLTGDSALLARAREEAEERGVDMSALDAR